MFNLNLNPQKSKGEIKTNAINCIRTNRETSTDYNDMIKHFHNRTIKFIVQNFGFLLRKFYGF